MNRRKTKLASLGIAACMSLAILAAPASTLTVQAAAHSGEETVMPMRDAISWMYKIENRKVYKRLYNHSTCNWIGDWIYVRDVPDDWVPPHAH